MHEITIVIPVFNQAYLTERCLNSLLENSKYINELIVINNNSSDNTSEVLKNFEIQFSRHGWKMSVITNQSNVGFGRAVN
ncbi:MAG: glycosyltransferase [Deltaproteobacteria bacterium]|nr:glycosyltransferase [Deltaproteobacteria bacterium]